MADLIEDGVNGYIVESSDADALANAMTRHFDAPDKHGQIHQAARESVATFTFTAAANAFEQAVTVATAIAGLEK